MIKNIFLPDHIGNYYLFNQRFVGISIDKNSITATQTRAHARSFFITSSHTEQLDATRTGGERIVAALMLIKETLTLPAHIQTSLPSSYVVFKELTLPFTSRQKINMVVRFEVEPLLPFPIADAIVDFIITQKNEANCQIMVAAVQKQHIFQHLSYFEQAGINLDAITIDLFDVYRLYTQIPSYASHEGFTILLDLGAQSTRIMGIYNRQLRVIRTLSQGTQHIAKDIAQSLSITPQQATDQLFHAGTEQTNSATATATTQALTSFWNKIQFALGSLANQVPDAKTITHILLFSDGANIKSFDQFINKQSGIPCSVFDVNALKENSLYKMDSEKALEGATVTSLAAALPSDSDFNLMQDEFLKPNTSLFVKQALMGCGLLILLFGSLLAHTIIQTRKLSNELAASENEAIEALKEQFPDLADETDLSDMIDAAKASIKAQEKTWMAFSSQSRTSFLEYLLELSTRINKQELGFVPKQLIIKDGTPPEIILDARVRDYDELKKLEQSLKESKLFNYSESQHTPEFTMKILIRQEKQGI